MYGRVIGWIFITPVHSLTRTSSSILDKIPKLCHLPSNINERRLLIAAHDKGKGQVWRIAPWGMLANRNSWDQPPEAFSLQPCQPMRTRLGGADEHETGLRFTVSHQLNGNSVLTKWDRGGKRKQIMHIMHAQWLWIHDSTVNYEWIARVCLLDHPEDAISSWKMVQSDFIPWLDESSTL